MTATNHALTGAIIGLVVAQPALALPAALLSHFVLDTIPHFKTSVPDKIAYKTKAYRNYLIGEALLCFLLVLTLVIKQPFHWWVAAICAFLAASPDLYHYRYFIILRNDKRWRPNLFERFSSRIQWFERPIGAVVEVAWA
ncbi:MAG TPA: hypothetical protein VLF87_03935, partial [Patescibacteria group bacterium]|nr:hypothetical protein [Patescibacteria group bacterium]